MLSKRNKEIGSKIEKSRKYREEFGNFNKRSIPSTVFFLKKLSAQTEEIDESDCK